ncbi:chorismate mutase [Streptomyces lonarensis]|uniref:Chorismate mutase n=1 Tax=Streptomyces lonarensis TaxID=700599 RepID=A0A7X6D236_9ACTN|nr:chorismate mutase [Streptomyces lonarensis]NJQ06798.1 chorismate mutase [Streptomyces lonarensis]
MTITTSTGTATLDAPATTPDATTPPAPAGPPTAPTAERDDAEWTGARTPEAAELVSGAREHIDVLDARILALIGERRAVSEQIQRARVGSGGRRVSLAREMEILERYREELGPSGTRMAMLLLELCRGRS